jgi:hypothetical protein
VNIVSLISSVRYRISVLILTIICTCGIFYLTLGTRPRIDLKPDILPITPALYNQWGQYADILNMGMYITNFAVSDFAQGLFMIDAYLWFEFDPQIFSLDTIEKFTVDKGSILEKKFIDAVKVEESIFVKYKTRFEVKSNLNFKYFPLDAHRLSIVVKYDNLAPSEVILTSFFTRTWFGYNAVSANWAYGQPVSDFGYIQTTLDSLDESSVSNCSAATVSFDFERLTIREAVVVILPFIVLLFIILASLSMMASGIQMLIIGILCILGMFIHNIVIRSMAPITSYYTLNDGIFLLVLGCAMLVIAFEVINAMYQEDTWWIDISKNVALTLSSLLFLVGWFYLLYLW